MQESCAICWTRSLKAASPFLDAKAFVFYWCTGGAAIGLAFGIAMRYVLRWMRHGGAGIEQQVALTFAVGYLSYYTANAPANFSGASGKLQYWSGVLVDKLIEVP